MEVEDIIIEVSQREMESIKAGTQRAVITEEYEYRTPGPVVIKADGMDPVYTTIKRISLISPRDLMAMDMSKSIDIRRMGLSRVRLMHLWRKKGNDPVAVRWLDDPISMRGAE